MRLLVVGVGNLLRRDDGIGPHIAEQLSALDWPGVDAIAVPQLAPELAETISQVDGVLLIDACVTLPSGTIAVRGVAGDGPAAPLTHALDIATLLAIAETIYGHRPRAAVAAIGARDFAVGTEIDAAVLAATPACLQLIRLLQENDDAWPIDRPAGASKSTPESADFSP